jgi:thiamine biosynthesis lipoprotein
MMVGAADVREGMGTGIGLEAFGPNAREALEAAGREAKRLEGLFSRFLAGSDVWRLNHAAGGARVSVSPETFSVLRRAREFSRATGGCFDVTVAPLSSLWDYRRAAVPEEDEVERARRLTDWRALELRSLRRSARLRPGQAVDLGGIAKGFAGDALMGVFRRHGVRSALVNFGGGVSALGARPDGAPWRVGVRHPREGGLAGALWVTECAVVTSGDYERCFFAGGRRYHHLIDPRTGYPADSGLISVTVVADSGITADALSTAAFIAGPDEGLRLIGRVKGAGAVLIDGRMRAFVTRNLAERFVSAGELETVIV